jgi:hypothetical protein
MGEIVAGSRPATSRIGEPGGIRAHDQGIRSPTWVHANRRPISGYALNCACQSSSVRAWLRRWLSIGCQGTTNPVINFSIMQTLARSVITSLTVVLTLLALNLFGGFSIRNFTLALLVGIVSGTYSSIFNAARSFRCGNR